MDIEQKHIMPQDSVIKSLIGVVGTFLSALGSFLDHISVIITILAGIGTALYMFEQWRKTRNNRMWQEEDREDGKDS